MSTITGSVAEERYRRALEFLSSFTDYEQIQLRAPLRTTFDLGRLERLLARQGTPHHHPGPVAHVTGTKGKSSVVWMVDALLAAHGLRSFRFLSPHVETVRERLAVAGRMVSRARFAALVERLEPTIHELLEAAPEEAPSFFEAMTVMGFHLARDERCDAAVLEVGLGGRLDATNVVDPAVAVITGVALDHTRVLGDTREAIAAEKAGIVKPGRPVLTALPPGDPAFEVVRARAEALGSPLGHPGRGLSLDRCELALGHDGRPSLRLSGRAGGFAFSDLPVATGSPAQGWNAVLALGAASEVLARQGRRLDPGRAAGALRRLRVPGRTEVLPGPRPLLLDGAHTRESVAGLLDLLDLLAPGRSLHLVIGLTRDREPAQVFGPLLERAASVTATRLPTPRSRSPEEVAAPFAGTCSRIALQADPRAALASAQAAAGRGEAVLVTGSLYLVGAVRPAAKGRPAPR